MQASSSRSVARCVFLVSNVVVACSGNTSPDVGNGGSPSMGGQTTAAFGGSSGTSTASPGGGSGGIPVITGGAAAIGTGGAVVATGGAVAATGGVVAATGGIVAATGGNKGSGGVSPATGGSTGAGAATSGGANTGGKASGGAAAGGTAAGGSPTGGKSSASGGAGATGGKSASGGAATGGSSASVTTGGSAAGGGTSTATKSAGCGKTSTVTFTTVPGESGTTVGTGQGGYVTINGRSFAMRLPDNYDNTKPYLLIFGFHWNGGTSKDVDTGGSNGYQMAHFGLQKLSNNGAIFVAPQGLNNGWGGDNLPFVDDMVKLIEDNYCVDTTRLYTNGFSYGGGMSYAIACARAKVFRGAAIYEGAVLSGCTGGNDPIAYWQMAGTTDTTCTIGGATPMRDKFAKNNGCTIPATEPPRPASISDAHICTNYTGCSAGHPLRWCVHPAGHGNAIVDGTTDVYNSCATPPKTCSDTCKCTWVPQDVWSFFTSL